jgi:hypothetical protein
MSVTRRRTQSLDWMNLAFKAHETLWASAVVIAHRTQRMAMAGAVPSARDHAEFARMWPEKVAAVASSARRVAMSAKPSDITLGAQVIGASMNAWLAYAALAGSRTPGQFLSRQARLAQALTAAQRATSAATARSARVASAAIDPFHRTTRSNSRRLGKPRPRSAR